MTYLARSWLPGGVGLLALSVLASGCYGGYDGGGYGGGAYDDGGLGVGYYQPYGGDYGGWGRGYAVGPFRNGEGGRFGGGGRPSIPTGGRFGGGGGFHGGGGGGGHGGGGGGHGGGGRP